MAKHKFWVELCIYNIYEGKIYEIQETPPPTSTRKETPPFFKYVHIWEWWIPWVKDKGTKDPKWDLFEVVSEDLI